MSALGHYLVALGLMAGLAGLMVALARAGARGEGRAGGPGCAGGGCGAGGCRREPGDESPRHS